GPRRSQAITPEPGAAGRHWLDQRPVVPDGVGKSDS
ncbi:arginine and alanine rich protein, partial [Mycobacterium tuberculosis BTB07-327]